MSKERILVVDDESDLCEILQFNIESEGYEVETAFSAEEALTKNISSCNLILLDVMMGGMSGFKLANLIRKDPKTATVPIIFLTAKDSENDKLTGFNLGADDYISKPFSIREIVARIKAVMKRCEKKSTEDQPIISYRTLEIDTKQKKVFINCENIPLTKKEYEMMRLFLLNKGYVFSREEILAKVWNDDVYVLDRTIDVNITRLRKKIGEYGKNIVTRLGYGYCFEID